MCPHEESVVSEGISSDKQRKFQNFYRHNSDLYAQEYGGMVSNSTRYCFSPEYLKLLNQRKHYPVKGPVDMIMVTIDPAGGGRNEWAFCACYYDTTINMQIIIQTDGLCIKNPAPSEISDWLRRSVEHVRRLHPAFVTPPILIACENAPLTVSNALAEFVGYLTESRIIQNVHMMYEVGADKGPGVPKNARNTEDMVRYANMLITNEQVCFSEVYSSCAPEKSPHDAKFEFINQLANFKPGLIRVTPDGTHVYKLHGKHGGKNDDMGVAYIMQYYWYILAMTTENSRYAFIRNYVHPRALNHVRIMPTGQSEHAKRIRDEVLANPHTKKRYDAVGYQNFSDSDDETYQDIPDTLIFD
jgi:hypothetical protein